MIRKSRIFVALLGASALAAVSAQPVFAQALEEQFQSPSNEVGPRIRWWWPGGDVTDEELARELKLLADNGFAGAEVQTLNPNFIRLTPEESQRVNQYAEPPYFEHLKNAGKAAAALGMELDYTLGSSWPPGGGFAITPEKALTELTMAVTEVEGGKAGPVQVTIPKWTRRLGAFNALDPRSRDPRVADWPERLHARAKIVAVVAMKGSAPETKPAIPTSGMKLSPWEDVITSGELDPASRVVLTDKLDEDGTLRWTPPPGKWQIFVFKRYAVDMGVLGAAGQGPQLALDPTDPEAFRIHAERTGDPLGVDPVGLRSTFIDSFELMEDIHWSPQMLAEFKKRRGYDLEPYLPFLLQPGWMQAWEERYSPAYFNADDSDIAERVRADYRRTFSELLIDGFVKPFVAWNHEKGMLAKLQAHGGPWDIIQAYGLADIPETEDLVHGADPLFMRWARSAAHMYGRDTVSIEGLAWAQRPFEVTPEDMRRRIDLIISGGVNEIIMHGMNYRYKPENWPGWHAFAPNPSGLTFSTMMNETNPIWPSIKPLAAYAARLQSVMQSGEPVVPVAYFYGRYGYYIGIEDDGAGKQEAEKRFIAGGYDFDRINPDSISRARVENRQLISEGGAHFGALVLPPIDAIRVETAEKIADFAKAGLPVFFSDKAPDRDEGLYEAKKRDKRVRAAVAAAMKAGAKVVPSDEIPSTLMSSGVVPNLAFAGNAEALMFVQRRVDDRLVTFVVNLADAERNVTVSLPQLGGVSRWNPMDGSIAATSANGAQGWTQVPLDLAAGASALLVLDPDEAPMAVADHGVIDTVALPVKNWSLSVKGHKGRAPYSHDFASITLQDWREIAELKNFSGEAVYKGAFTLSAEQLPEDRRILLDLGEVHDMATVSINGQLLAPAISSPFRVDVTDHVKSGANDLTVTVANVPQNALVGIKETGYDKLKYVPAGLVGPLQLVVEPK